MEHLPHRVLTVESRRSIDLPLSDVMRSGHIEVFPHVEDQGLLFLQFRRGRVIVTAGKFVGLIPLTPDISIEVKPKLPVSNLAHVLEISRASLASLKQVDRLYDLEGAPGSTVLAFLLRNLVDALTPVRTQGLLKDYIRQSQVSSEPRGHINVAASLQTCWSKGQRHRVNVDRFEQTSNVAPNRLIRQALEYALTVLSRNDGDAALLKIANEAYHELPDQIGKLRPSDYGTCYRLVEGQRLPISRGYYYRALEIALLILSKRAISLDRIGSDIALQTFILDFEDVFERYLRRVLQLRAPSGIQVRGQDAKRSLYDDRPNPTAEPDIVVQAGGAPLVAEVKYKDKPERSDINQAVTYAVCYRTDRVVLLHQRRANGRHGRYDIGIVNGIRVEGYAFDLAAADLDAEEAIFASILFSMAPIVLGMTLAA